MIQHIATLPPRASSPLPLCPFAPLPLCPSVPLPLRPLFLKKQ